MSIKILSLVKCLPIVLSITSSLIKAQTVSPPPKFSVERGFYNESFSVSIDAETTAVIKYTLDGSDPRYSATALQQNSPATVFINPDSTTGRRGKGPGVVLRASTLVPGLPISEPVSHTYLFVHKAASLSPNGVKPGLGWPDVGWYNGQLIDYGMSSTVVNDTRYKDLLDDALLSIPTFSIATDLQNLFSTDSGIYVNAMLDGIEWERPASVELINPDGSKGFQINAGIRIRGGWSRHGDNPKHAFRLFFRTEYGNGKLKYPLFGDEGADEFDKIDLRTSQNYSWSYPGHQGEYNIMNREVFSRDLQRELGQPYTRSRYYHLYLNGVYWGLFQTQERSEARYAATYFGGTVEDYDVVKNGDGYVVEATDGNLDAYTELWNLCSAGFSNNKNYFKAQGLDSTGMRDTTLKVLVDVDNLIDYMLIIFYAGNFDSPTSKFRGNQGVNNFYTIYNRNGKEGFKFLVHDAEHTLRTTAGEGPGIGLQENRVNISMSVTGVDDFHPQWLHNRLAQNAEYKIRFADHVYRHFFNDGWMTPSKATALFLSRASEIDTAIIAESARWGDTYSTPPRTKDDDWQVAINDIVNNYFPYRTGIVLNQLKTAGLFPNITPPVFMNSADTIKTSNIKFNSAYTLKLVNSNGTTGTIYYTTDGSDPRAIGGGIAATALNGGDSISISVTSTVKVKARILNGSTWSALHEAQLFSTEGFTDIKITEIHYHPLDEDTTSDNEYEFLEIKNTGASAVNISQAYFSSGVTYTFPANTILHSGQLIVLASNAVEFNRRYQFMPFDEYTGQLDNGGERITLLSAGGDTIFSVRYDDDAPWPTEPDGAGYSLVTKEINPTGDLNDPALWRASSAIHGSPGADDPPTSVEKLRAVPNEFALYQNYPNPFNPATTISYSIKTKGRIKLTVFDLLGRIVAQLVDNVQEPGRYMVHFSGSKLSSGIYFYKLESPEGNLVKRMLLIK